MNKDDDGTFGSKYELSGMWKECYEEYAGMVSSTEEKITTADRLKAGCRAWLSWCEEEELSPFDVTERDVRLYVREMDSEGYAEPTITRRFATVSKYYYFLSNDPVVDVDLTEENPTSDISLSRDFNISNTAEYPRVLDREGRSDVIALDYSEIEPIFDHVPGSKRFTRTRNKLVCHLFWQTAVRSDELARFRADNIEWDKREIEVRSSKLNRDDHPQLYHRRVWWESELDLLMRRWQDLRARVVDGDCPYWIVSDTGNQLSSGYLSRIVKDAAHNAGINEPLTRDDDGEVSQWLYTGHRLRHSRITQLANHTSMDLNFIRMLAGHAQISTTLSYVSEDWDAARNSFRECVD